MSRLWMLLSLFASFPALAGDFEAEEISRRIRAYHMPFGVVADTRFKSPTSTEILEIGDGDGAIWTGHYLMAEAYHYAVTRSPEALEYVRTALQSVKDLCEVSGTGRIARTLFPPDAPYIDWSRQTGTWHRTTYNGKDLYYISYVTRDQYDGIFLGLGAVYDLVDDEGMRNEARSLITRLVEHLIKSGWILIDRDAGRWIETYVGRYDHMFGVLQLAAHVNPERFRKEFETAQFFWTWAVGVPILFSKNDSKASYFGFNLTHGYLFNLIHLEQDGKKRREWMKTYSKLRNLIKDDLNAWFNMIDFALNGPDAARDQVTRQSLDELLERGFRDYPVDLSGKYEACAENYSCQVIPVRERVWADFLWQRPAHLLQGGSDGSLESPGVDYILPYWMARYYGVL